MSIFQDNLQRLKDLKELMNWGDLEIKILSEAVQVKQANLFVNGNKYPAWRIVHNRALGPGKGGVRFHPNVSEDEVSSLAFWMALKNSLADIPYGGAKGGIKLNPKKLSQQELENISRAYIDEFYQYLGQDKDIPAPDVYTNSQTMSWMLDEFEKKVAHHEPGAITGKPLELGGLALRSDATAQGGYLVSKEMISEFLSDKQKIKIVIQGFGNAGLFIAKKLFQDKYQIIAVSDSKGGIYNENGLDIETLITWKNNGHSVSEHKSGKAITNAKLLEVETDILVLAALENQITQANANNIKANYMVELANGPISYEADKILAENNKLIVPDILANSGGVIVSYFEWAQNRTGQILDKEYLSNLLTKKMRGNWQRVYDKYREQEKKITLRQAAYILATEKILKAEKLRGRF